MATCPCPNCPSPEHPAHAFDDGGLADELADKVAERLARGWFVVPAEFIEQAGQVAGQVSGPPFGLTGRYCWRFHSMRHRMLVELYDYAGAGVIWRCELVGQ